MPKAEDCATGSSTTSMKYNLNDLLIPSSRKTLQSLIHSLVGEVEPCVPPVEKRRKEYSVEATNYDDNSNPPNNIDQEIGEVVSNVENNKSEEDSSGY